MVQFSQNILKFLRVWMFNASKGCTGENITNMTFFGTKSWWATSIATSSWYKW